MGPVWRLTEAPSRSRVGFPPSLSPYDSLGSVREELRTEIRQGDEETRRYMRILHEEVISRITTIQEGHRQRNKK